MLIGYYDIEDDMKQCFITYFKLGAYVNTMFLWNISNEKYDEFIKIYERKKKLKQIRNEKD
jgi:hypothetical protein